MEDDQESNVSYMKMSNLVREIIDSRSKSESHNEGESEEES